MLQDRLVCRVNDDKTQHQLLGVSLTDTKVDFKKVLELDVSL